MDFFDMIDIAKYYFTKST